MRKVIYTAIIGDYDTLKEPEYITPGWEYVCFTDQNIVSKHWEVVKLFKTNDRALAVREARRIKILCPFEHDVSIWMDASFTIKGNADEFVEKAGTYDLMMMKHPHRSYVSEEADACIRLKKDSEKVITNQIKVYKETHDINSLPLAATGIIYRENTSKICDFNNIWNMEVEVHSHRDQLSVGMALKTSGIDYKLLDENIYDKNNKFFSLNKHK